jgi:hypothetical protein
MSTNNFDNSKTPLKYPLGINVNKYILGEMFSSLLKRKSNKNLYFLVLLCVQPLLFFVNVASFALKVIHFFLYISNLLDFTSTASVLKLNFFKEFRKLLALPQKSFSKPLAAI